MAPLGDGVAMLQIYANYESKSSRAPSSDLRVLYTLMSVSRSAGGVQGAAMNLGKFLVAAGQMELEVLAPSDQHSRDDLPLWVPVVPRLFATRGPRNFSFAPGMLRAIQNSCADLMHCHGLWIYPNVAASIWSHRTGRPYLISPHGMLEPEWELKKSRFRKQLALSLFQRRHLAGAACIHALNEAEVDHVRRMGLRNPVCVIPNGIEMPTALASTAPPWAGRVPDGKRKLLYLGRITRKKGIENLLHAVEQLRKQNWVLVVAGWDQGGHRHELERQAVEMGVRDAVVFLDPVYGDGKESAYQNADAFVLPSHSEGLPLVVLEAWAHGLPVLMTDRCNIPEGAAAGAAITVAPTVDALGDGVRRLLNMTEGERRKMGGRGRELVATHFTWGRIAAQMRSVYDWVLGSGPRPDCVHLD